MPEWRASLVMWWRSRRDWRRCQVRADLRKRRSGCRSKRLCLESLPDNLAVIIASPHGQMIFLVRPWIVCWYRGWPGITCWWRHKPPRFTDHQPSTLHLITITSDHVTFMYRQFNQNWVATANIETIMAKCWAAVEDDSTRTTCSFSKHTT